MTSRSQAPVSFTAPADEVEEWDQRAEQQGLSRSEWLRQRIRAGHRLWSATGDFNHETLNALFEATDTQASTDTQSDTDATQLAALLEQNLSTTTTVPESDLEDIVSDLMYDTLHDLQEAGKIKHVPGRGYKLATDDE